ncbi:hypothetical protein [Methylocaldum gracile]|jgi:hypothetical protein|uniref:hypothetical protein n=1 Tax=Methylocaldum sp. 0917 TaxID=2485163 RepID=UPI00105ED7CD
MSELFLELGRALNPAINDQHPRGTVQDKIAFLNDSDSWRDIFTKAGLDPDMEFEWLAAEVYSGHRSDAQRRVNRALELAYNAACDRRERDMFESMENAA